MSTTFATGIDAFKSVGEDQGSDEKRMPYFTPQEGKTELIFLTDFNEKNGFPPLLIYKSYAASVQGRNGDYTRRFAYFEGDDLHPEHVEKKQAEGKDPKKSVSNRVLSVVFNRTLYNASQKQKNGERLKKIEKAYLENLKEGVDPAGPFIYDAGATVIKGLVSFVKEQEDEDVAPSLFDYVFELNRQGLGMESQYVISADEEYSDVEDDLKEHLATLKDREEFKAPSELVEFKRYRAPEEETTVDSKFSIANLSPQTEAPSSGAKADAEDDEW